MKYRYVLVCVMLMFPLFALAQEGITGNSSEPIDIVSDTLTVDSKMNIALFEGGVEAKQGTLTLLSDSMKVFYQNAGNTESENSLSKIITKGSTKLIVPDKKASSTNGIYDVDKGLILLQGNVVLNRGENQLEGDKFWYNVKTGESRVTSDTKAVKGKAVGGKKKKRVKGVFVPKPSAESK